MVCVVVLLSANAVRYPRSMNRSVITGLARTPIGKYGGGLSPLRAVDLGGVAIEGAMKRSGFDSSAVDEVIFGHVLGA
ncbi:MAG: hypothetical protein GEU79_13075, partial [Acidimicrobiia bacterium]|nr:hypothetical protein [Acidimicrobiia bacterium]